MCIICEINNNFITTRLNNRYPLNIFDFINITEIICCDKIPYLPNLFINLTKLNCKNYDGNIILPNSYTNLKILESSGCILYTIPNTYINLEYLNCSYTELDELPFTLINLKYLDCSYTNLLELPYVFQNLENLLCNNTDIERIPDTFENLEYLHCSETDIEEIPNTLIKLKILDCNNTLIHSIPETLINIRFLYCTNTNIYNIPHQLINLIELESNILDCESIILRQKKIKNGFIKFIKLYKYYKIEHILWNIAEYYSAKKYSPNNILNYNNLY